MNWLSKELILDMHDQLLAETGGSTGVRDESLLESALNAPLQVFDGMELFPSVVEKAVRLSFGLSANHAFVDGNKRISALALLIVLQINKMPLRQLQKGELSEIFLKVADGSADYEELLRWTKERI
ncbi:Fic family protein [Butyricicoccus faecihominis]|uniref:type II toxin-antitoxin system death-on-curing family toxin n=1 Tax=Butyricicoccus faecihominis TaxID=1712515 RepID=UPI00247A106E|nr:Fic family protein [Butyricicoccus faecihominis]MCQ5128071.1 Fic family protein [Butyricicoccus faecihominis]